MVEPIELFPDLFAQAAQQQTVNDIPVPQVDAAQSSQFNASNPLRDIQSMIDRPDGPGDIQFLIDNNIITNSQAIEIANRNKINIASLKEFLTFDDMPESMIDKVEEANKIADEDSALAARNNAAADELAAKEEQEEQAIEDAEAEAAAEAAEEAEQEQEMFDGPDFSFGADDAYEQYLENELWDEFLEDDGSFEEEQEPEMAMSSAIGEDGDDMGEDSDLEAEGTDIGSPEQELSALTSPEIEDPELEGEGKDAEGVEEGLEGVEEGLEADGVEEDLGEMEVAEFGKDGLEKTSPELEADKVEAPSITPVVALATDQDLNQATALAAMSGDVNAQDVFFKSRDEKQSQLSQDIAQTGQTPDVQQVVETTKAAVNDVTPAVEAPKEEEVSVAPSPASKGPMLATKTSPIEPGLKDSISQFANDPRFAGMNQQFMDLAVKKISETHTAPSGLGTEFAATASLPKMGGNNQLAV